MTVRLPAEFVLSSLVASIPATSTFAASSLTEIDLRTESDHP